MHPIPLALRFRAQARALASDIRVRLLAGGLAAVAIIGVAVGSGTPPSIPSIPLAAEPLYARGARAKPTLTLALSVEFPTVGAQYVNGADSSNDDTYAATNEYVGYFDAESCYSYNNDSDPALRRFDRIGAATHRECGGTGFSGNFLNWATASAIDILRYGLTGGDRVVDTASLTVLQRAYLPTRGDNNPGNFYNGSNFPSKRITNAVAAGALPSALLGSHTNDVYIANCSNRVHFGTTKGGNCDAPGFNADLHVVVPSGSTSAPTVLAAGALPPDFAACAARTANCTFSGAYQVAYGSVTIGWKVVSAKDTVLCDNAPFGGSPGSGTKSCFARPSPTVVPATSLSSDPFFYTRVSVCGADGSGTLTDPRSSLCLRYPNGNYKPVGNLQKYSDRVRVAAFGYLIDNVDPAQRNGAVLRAPMKYVGPKHYDANFSLVSGANPNQEWDTATGVFVANPDAAAEGNSGVTNYLNQFGRTGATPGNYKRYDPVGELYYEALRYIQGLPPTASAVSGMTAAMKDGFAAYDSWTDPHPPVAGTTDYSCVRNNIVAIGDVNTWNDKYFPGNTRTDANDATRSASVAVNEPDFMWWTKVVGAFESNHAEVSYLDGKGVTQSVSNFNPANTARWGMENQGIGAGGGSASYYMAGAAYWANTHDIRGADWSDTDKRRPGMRATTYVLDVNEYAQQTAQSVHKQNQFFLAAKYGGFKDASETGNPYKAKDGSDTNLNWESPTIPGDAKNYYLSSSARGVLTALDEIFANIAKEANSIAGGAISTQRLTSVGGFIFQAQFDPADWSGDLIPYPVTLVGGSDIEIGDASAAPWTAATKLDAKAPGARKIYVGKSTPTGATATEFTWTHLDTDAKEWLRTPPGAPTGTPLDAEAVGEARLDFLRGVRSLEAPAGTLRKRGKVLGDIVNSGVAYSGAPSLRISDPSYVADFASTYKDRAKVLFVGANDGMLHAFDSADGDELFAYIPSWVVPRLNALTSPAYLHQTYVDASPVVAEAKVGSAWKTVLVGGTGGGGQGVYALDVSDPSAFDAGKVMWEFTDRDDASLGNVIGRPAILKFKTGPATYKYFAVVASGVNNYVDDGHYSSTGAPAIFLLDLAKAASSAWEVGVNYHKIELPIATTSIASGMANFTTRSGLDDAVTQLYAGDLQGNLWKLDFAGKEPADWTIANLSYYKDGSAPIPMYVARDGAANLQPITMPPFLAYGPNRTTLVAFGTGKYLEAADNSGPFRAQSVYALLDDNKNVADSSSSPTSAISGRGRLQAATANAGGTVTNSAFTWGRPLSDGDTTMRSGWYFDMPTSSTTGERQISPFTGFGSKVYSGTVIPPQTSCEIGSGRSYEIDLFSGTGSHLTSDVGILGEPFVLAVGSDALTTSNSLDQAVRTTQARIVLQGSGNLKNSKGTEAVASVFRMSWRQINNYQEVKAAP